LAAAARAEATAALVSCACDCAPGWGKAWG
jgi:hypothetical protein